MSLKPCPYRHVGEEGHILCDKIKTGDRQVSLNICRACPVAQINCTHLRATLDHQAHPPVTVRWGNGKTEIWEDDAPSLAFQNAACAEKVIPVHSPRDCAGCTLRQPLLLAETIPTADRRPQSIAVAPSTPRRRTNAPRGVPSPVAQPIAQVTLQPAAEARSSIVAQKIIQLQEWLNRPKSTPAQNDEPVTPASMVYTARPTARAVGEEKRVGWTD